MSGLRTPNLDAQSDLIVIRSLYSILLAARAVGTKVQGPLTNGRRSKPGQIMTARYLSAGSVGGDVSCRKYWAFSAASIVWITSGC